MIPRPYTAKWKDQVAWRSDAQVEQDLIISRALVEIFSDEFLRENLAFRGGTALYKLYMNPAPRYSEDIDLVQIKEGPIRPLLQRIGEKIMFFEEPRVVKPKTNNNTILYRFTSESAPVQRLKLKIEINCREHFNLLGLNLVPFQVDNDWFSGKCEITTYYLDELLGTKLRALYQRKKGRDLFDLFYASQHADLNLDRIIQCYLEYMKFVAKKTPSRKEFIINLKEKQTSPLFLGDMVGLIGPEIKYDPDKAFDWLIENIIPKIS
ncbi:MAG: nucleotidyl transferase AbiEii/AbiGii toxin family protein [Bacteroidia bacterium]|nr:nucleotidyl transferase AbiEii/AbiGii toxin family protein [Bacteroidia bacterium]